jgi:two-component system NtrC family sensor kinase
MMVASVVLPAALFAVASWVSHRDTHAVADERLDRSLDILHEHALKVFQTVERVFAEVEEVLRGMSDDEIRVNDRRLNARFKQITDALPQLQGIAVIDRSGRALVSSNAVPTPRHDLSDRSYFTAHLDGDAGTYVSEVLSPRLPGLGTYFFTLSRRRPPIDSQFNGVVSVAVLPGYFEQFYARIGRSAGSYYAMVRDDGAFLARYPVPTYRTEKLGPQSGLRRSLAQNPDRSIYSGRAQTDGVERRFGYRKLAGFPIYALAGTEMSAIQAEWLGVARSHLVFGLPATLLLFAIIGLTLKRTQRLYAEAERREIAESALRQSQRLEALGQLTGGVAHDFNNLLMVVSGSAQRLRRDLTDDKHTRLLDMIASATQRGESLTRQLLTYARRQMLTPVVVDLTQQLPKMKDMLVRSLRGDIEVRVVVPEVPCRVLIDIGELEIAVLNLAVNARDAMPSGGVLTLRVKPVTLKGEAVADGLSGDFAALRVADNGEGIPPDVLARVFEPFFTTKEVGKGTGLGLSQVYGFAKQSGGTATVTSQVGRGTTITLYLPQTEEALPEVLLAPEPPVVTRKSGSVLVVEDNAEVAEVCAGYFDQIGYRVEVASTSHAALDLLQAGAAVDLVFSDILMPGGMNGVDLAYAIRQQYPHLPVLLSTGYSSSAQHALRQGFVVLQKPYGLAQLEKALAELFARAEPGERQEGKVRRAQMRSGVAAGH